MWLAIPALAVVTALGVWVIGLQLREGANTAHTTIVADLPTARQILSHVLVTSPNGGLEGIELPEGWRSVSTNEENWGGPIAVAAAPILRDGALLTELDPGGIGVLAPDRRKMLAELGVRALIAGTLACLMTACVAGMLY